MNAAKDAFPGYNDITDEMQEEILDTFAEVLVPSAEQDRASQLGDDEWWYATIIENIYQRIFRTLWHEFRVSYKEFRNKKHNIFFAVYNWGPRFEPILSRKFLEELMRLKDKLREQIEEGNNNDHK